MKYLLSHALELAARGFCVFPVHSVFNNVCTCGKPSCPDTAKHPHWLKDTLEHGCKDATTDPGLIRHWWEAFPMANIGIAPTQDYLVIDCDAKPGQANGNETLAELERQHGPLPRNTPTVRSGSGDGRHYYFRLPKGLIVRSGNGVLAGIDIRSAGGYVLAPPSLHKSGNRYESLVGYDTMMDCCPDWFIARLPRPGQSKAAAPPSAQATKETLGVFEIEPAYDLSNHPGSGEGERNGTLCRLVGLHCGRGDSLATIEALALRWNERCDPPKDEEPILKSVRNIWEKEQAKRQAEPDTPPPHTEADDEAWPRTGSVMATPVADADAEDDTLLEPEPDTGPVLSPEAYHGLAGDIVKAVSGRTEADEPAVLLSLLAAFGSAVGLSPCWDHGQEHGANLNLLLVGPTTARKGTAWSVGSHLVTLADEQWASTRLADEGCGTGEGIIYAVRDTATTTTIDKRTGEVSTETVPGVADKRLCLVDEEFAKPLRLMKSKESILAATLRACFNRKAIGKLTKNAPCKCQKPHVSIVGHITPSELLAELKGSTHIANGLINRFLLCRILRTKFIPRKGNWRKALEPFRQAVADALTHAKGQGLLELDDAAGTLWDGLYQSLETRPNTLFGLATSRASDQVMKLSLAFALLDKASAIGLPHLRAGLALWRYCEASARWLFAEQVPLSPLAQKILDLLATQPHTKTNIIDGTNRNYTATEIAAALAELERAGLAYSIDERKPNGRTVRLWHHYEYTSLTSSDTSYGTSDVRAEPMSNDNSLNSYTRTGSDENTETGQDVKSETEAKPGLAAWDGVSPLEGWSQEEWDDVPEEAKAFSRRIAGM